MWPFKKNKPKDSIAYSPSGRSWRDKTHYPKPRQRGPDGRFVSDAPSKTGTSRPSKRSGTSKTSTKKTNAKKK